MDTANARFKVIKVFSTDGEEYPTIINEFLEVALLRIIAQLPQPSTI